MKVDWTHTARHQLRHGVSYIRDRNRTAALKLATKIRKAIARIARSPQSGILRDDLALELRCVVVDPFVIYYTIKRGAVLIVRVLHGAQDADAEFA